METGKGLKDMQDLPMEDVQLAVDVLFKFLRDVLYDPKHASLDPEQLAEPFRDLAKGVAYIAKCIEESRTLANDLARGNLDSSIRISKDNDIADGLKSLQSTLKHISWQVSQVAKGDYNQRLSFTGAFSDSINDMIGQLKEREEALRKEIEINQQLAADARNTVELLEGITKSIEELIIVVDRSTFDWLYTNYDVSLFLPDPESIERLKAILKAKIQEFNEKSASESAQAEVPTQTIIELERDESFLNQHFSVTGYPITWTDRRSLVFVLVNITAERREREELEQAAYSDSLTSIYSRHYGMMTFERWLDEKQSFILAFVDMDGLKYVNDTFGHTAGDEYIIATARIFSYFGNRTVICRLGGDEFMLLIRDHTMEQARTRLEEMRAKLADDFEGPYDRSFSFGLVEAGEDNTKSASLLLSIADENMFEDKRKRKKERRALQ